MRSALAASLARRAARSRRSWAGPSWRARSTKPWRRPRANRPCSTTLAIRG